MLGEWVRALAELADGGVAFLPYDYSDQGTSWLRVERTGTQFRIQPGGSLVEGHSIDPTDLIHRTVPADFKPLPEAPALQLSVADCLQALRTSRARVRGH